MVTDRDRAHPGPSRRVVAGTCLLGLLLAACGPGDRGGAPPPDPVVATAGMPGPPPGGMRRLAVAGAGWAFEAEWPERLARYPALRAAVESAVDRAREDLEAFALPEERAPGGEAAAVEGQDPGSAIVETQMRWSLAVETPTLVTAVLEGYTYSGGAHGMPLHAVLHLDPGSGALLPPEALCERPEDWAALAARIRQELYRRAEADLAEMPPELQGDARAGTREWIDRGTEPGPETLGLFVPGADAAGRFETLDFVFPPYQVGPYVDGTQTVRLAVGDIGAHLSARWARALGAAR